MTVAPRIVRGRSGALEAALLDAVRERAPGEAGPAVVNLDVTDGDPYALRIGEGRVWVTAGKARRPNTTIVSDTETLAAIIEGSRSGVEAFLAGDLRVRGNMALSLRLGGLLGDADQPSRFPRAGSVAADGHRTFYLEAGQGSPVILLHGLGATNASLLPTMWDLAADHRVIAPDMPGFGDSAKPLRRYDSRFYARWLGSFLDEVGVDRTDLVGNSMGGRVAIELALRHPERAGRLVLLAPSPAFIRRRQLVRLVRLLRPELALLRTPVPHRLVVRGIKRMFARPDRVDDSWYRAAADEFLRVFSSVRGRIAFFSAARQIYLEEPYGDEGFWDRLPSLGVPALFVWGQRDRLVPWRFARHVERALPAAESVILEDCGHVPQYEHPERTHRLIRRFLD